MVNLWCNVCKEEIVDRDQKALNSFRYCNSCWKMRKVLVKLNPKNTFLRQNRNPTFDDVGLKYDVKTIRGKALKIMRDNHATINSDELLFLEYLKKYEEQWIIHIPPRALVNDLIKNIVATPDKAENIIIAFFNTLKVDYTDLPSFQTLRLARQELRREAKRKGMIQLFDPIVEERRTDREEIIKKRYKEEIEQY